MKFNYQARDSRGQTQVGVVEASSKEAALQILGRHGLYITLLEETKKRPVYARRLAFFERVSAKDIMLFSRQLAILFKSQVTLIEALRTLSLQTGSSSFKEKILEISEDIEGGTSLSQALGKYPALFSPYYVSVVRSGEVSGSLSGVLFTLADHLEREYELRSKIKAALTYPAFILGTGLIVVMLLMLFVIPNLTRILGDLGGELPLATRIVISFADALRRFWFIFILVAAAGIFGLLRYVKTASGKKAFDGFLLQVPLLNEFLRMIYLSRFAENLSTLISGGLPIVEALEITRDVVGNETYKAIIEETKEGVKGGDRISDSLSKYPKEFPPLFTQMILVGEKSGSLDSTLLNVVQFYQKEVAHTVENFLSILEPLLIVVLGLLVGGLMAAILLPLYKVISF
ncbi:MAG: type II secretion system F family protein [Candidatus Wildermuthbacteria bacterium]|nr:type II secretion system F family protein [Candidatus Wildermuthbacteria bacterium]